MRKTCSLGAGKAAKVPHYPSLHVCMITFLADFLAIRIRPKSRILSLARGATPCVAPGFSFRITFCLLTNFCVASRTVTKCPDTLCARFGLVRYFVYPLGHAAFLLLPWEAL